MQRRFIKIDSAENLYNETELAFNEIGQTWSDIYFIKINGKLVSSEDFKNFTEKIDFSPFKDIKNIKQIDIYFNNGSLMRRMVDKNFRRCYCFYDVNASELTPEEIEEKFGENSVTFSLIPNSFQLTKSGKDDEKSYINLDNLEDGKVVDLDTLVDKTKVENDDAALPTILKRKKYLFKPIKDEEIVASSSVNKELSKNVMKKEDLDKILSDLKESMSEEDLENFNEEEFIKSLNVTFGDEPEKPLPLNQIIGPLNTHYYKGQRFEDTGDITENTKTFVGYYYEGNEVSTSSKNKSKVTSKEIIIVEQKEISYDQMELTYFVKKTIEGIYEYKMVPNKILKGVFKANLDFYTEDGKKANYILEDTYLDIYVRAKMGIESAIKAIKTLEKKNTIRISTAYDRKIGFEKTIYEGPFTKIIPKDQLAFSESEDDVDLTTMVGWSESEDDVDLSSMVGFSESEDDVDLSSMVGFSETETDEELATMLAFSESEDDVELTTMRG